MRTGPNGKPGRWRRLAGLWLACLMLAPAIAHADSRAEGVHDFYATGVVPNQGNARLLGRFVDWLARAGGYPLHLHFVESYDDLSDALRRDADAVGWTCGAPFVQDHARDGQQLVAVPLYRGRPEYHSVVIANRNRSGDDLADFASAVFAYSDPRSNSGFVVPSWYLRQQGQAMRDFFRLLVHAGSHERSIRAVAAGLADVAAVDEYVWDVYRRRHPQEVADVREVQRLGPYPFTPVVAGRAVPPEVVAAMRTALERMSDDPEGRAILAALELDGFVSRPVSFYAPIARMLDAVEVQR